MKSKIERSFNSTLRMGSCELKRTALKPVSSKRKAQNLEYREIKDLLIKLADGKSELTGLRATTQPLVIHHVNHRENARLLDVFNMIVVKQEPEHTDLGKHHSFEEIQKVLALVKEIRFRQGWKYGADGASIYAPDKPYAV